MRLMILLWLVDQHSAINAALVEINVDIDNEVAAKAVALRWEGDERLATESASLCAEFDECLCIEREALERTHTAVEKICHDLWVEHDNLKAKAHDAAVKLLPAPKGHKKGKHKATFAVSEDESTPTSSL
jgi:hypothetical protein